ncbi:MAG: hypothetical protein JJU02_06720 [Cryomorphaceae bacterium]|nr:hypothetical protein [Cryomorphaceae bacterium]
MSVDFYKNSCQKSTDKKKFGLFDPEDKTPARLMFNDEEDWNATVINEDCKTILFTAIDNCIDVLNENGEMGQRCDCMLTYNSTLLFVELKNKRASWQADGLHQIENIAKIMMEERPNYYSNFSKRRAIVANRKNKFPAFKSSNKGIRQYFYAKYKLRIQFEAIITI